MKDHLASFLTKVKSVRLPSKKPLIIMGIVVVLIGVSASAVVVPSVTKSDAHGKAADQHKDDLKNIVDTGTGAPENGRDPASQKQNSLAAAASSPDGPGQRGSKPAANVQGDHSYHADVPANQPGTTSGGCVIGYGKAGEQCLPTPGQGKTVTCDYVHSKGFHHGLAVTGNDPYHLDKNHDKTACGHGD